MDVSTEQTTTTQPLNAQQRFDQHYMTSSEVAQEVGVNRTTVLQARRKGYLPEPIVVNDGQVILFERHVVRPFIDAWKVLLTARRARQA